jgi:hypothetical protein
LSDVAVELGIIRTPDRRDMPRKNWQPDPTLDGDTGRRRKPRPRNRTSEQAAVIDADLNARAEAAGLERKAAAQRRAKNKNGRGQATRRSTRKPSEPCWGSQDGDQAAERLAKVVRNRPRTCDIACIRVPPVEAPECSRTPAVCNGHASPEITNPLA